MSKVVQIRGIEAAVASLFTGTERELVVNLGTFALGVHDGFTPGGHVLLLAENNLADLLDKSAARAALELGSAAKKNTGDFLQVSNNLSDLDDKTGARANLGLGNIVTHAITDVFQVANNLSEIQDKAAARTNLGLGSAATHAHGDYDLAGSANALLDDIQLAYDRGTAGVNAATAAQGTANTALANAATADGKAVTAQNTANTAIYNASIAKSAADTGIANAAIAQTAAETANSTSAKKANNLSDLTSKETARANLSLETAVLEFAGAVDGSTAAAGKRGQALRNSNVYSGTLNSTNVCTLVLSPGRWLVFANASISSTSVNQPGTTWQGGISLVSGALPITQSLWGTGSRIYPPSSSFGEWLCGIAFPPQVLSVAANTTVYLPMYDRQSDIAVWVVTADMFAVRL